MADVIILGANGPTGQPRFFAGKLASELLAAITISAYCYMPLVPIIRPPFMRALTTQAESETTILQLRKVSKTEIVVFPTLLLIALPLPSVCAAFGDVSFW